MGGIGDAEQAGGMTEMTIPASARVRTYLGGVAPRASYLLFSFPIALLSFIIVLTLVATGAGAFIAWFGLPILWAGLRVARGFGDLERGMLRNLLDRDIPEPVRAPRRGFLRQLADPDDWLAVLWVFIRFVVSTITFSVALTWVVGILAIVLGPVATFVVAGAIGEEHYGGLAQLMGFHGMFGLWLDAMIDILGGLFFLVTARPVLGTMAAAQASLAHGLLFSRAETRQQIAAITASRDAVRAQEATELRRLERDLHDGAQQQLVRLQLDLAMAERRTDDPDQKATLDAARQQTQDVLQELRRLSRGIAPPVLADRGLGAAVTELAARSLVPVTVNADVPRLPAHVENAAYFVVSEAFANANKHSLANDASVDLTVEGGVLHVVVTDGGVGGASMAKGHGLAGLAQRIQGVDGSLDITSPAGGPTIVQARIPCGS